MRRRDKTGGKAVKRQRRQTVRRRNTAKVARRRKPYAADANEKVALLEQKLNEALEQQTAMSEILGVISNSPTDLAPVFSAILANATRLCEGNLAALWRYNGKFLIGAAQYNASAAFVDKYMGTKMEPGRAGPARLAALERRTVHVADITAEPSFSPVVLQYERARSVLAVPLLREKDLVGVIAIWRREVRPFTDKQIELVRNFAAQAVIAIENTRLLTELRQRTTDLTELLEHQTATGEILRVISSSPTNVQPVFDTIAINAQQLCDATFSVVLRFNGELIELASFHNLSPQGIEAIRQAFPRSPHRTGRSATDEAIRTYATAYFPDVLDDATYLDQDLARATGYRSVLSVPMLRDGRPVGAITVAGSSPRAFSEPQMALLRTFADQAVIAIENVRLFNETKEALERQTATANVLKVISRSTFDLQTVLEYSDRIGGTALRGRQRDHLSAGWRGVSAGRQLRLLAGSGAVRGRTPSATEPRQHHRASRASGPGHSYSGCAG